MTWPFDGEPRYIVSCSEGFNHPGGNGSKWAETWAVLDRAYGHRVVREFLFSGRKEYLARDLARRLNAAEQAQEAA